MTTRERMIEGGLAVWKASTHLTSTAKNVDRRGARPDGASIYGRGAGEGFGVPTSCPDSIAILDARPRRRA